MARIRGLVIERKAAELINKRVATRFIWIPGISPVIIPQRIPIRIAKMISSIFVMQ